MFSSAQFVSFQRSKFLSEPSYTTIKLGVEVERKMTDLTDCFRDRKLILQQLYEREYGVNGRKEGTGVTEDQEHRPEAGNVDSITPGVKF